MKKSFLPLIIVVFVLAMFSCQDDDPISVNSDKIDQLSPGTFTLTYKGGERKVTVDIDGSWTPQAQVEWITIGEISPRGFTFSIDENSSSDIRRGEIWVTRPGKDPLKAYVNQKIFNFLSSYEGNTQFNFSPYGGEEVLDMTDYVDWEIVVDESFSWINARKVDDNLVVEVGKVPDSQYRSGTFRLTTDGYGEVKFTVSQQGATITPSEKQYSFDCSGGNARLSIAANIDWEISSDSDWITVEADENTVDIYVNHLDFDFQEMRYQAIPGGTRTGNLVVRTSFLSEIRIPVRQTDKIPFGWDPSEVPNEYEVTSVDSRHKKCFSEMEITYESGLYVLSNFYGDFPVHGIWSRSQDGKELGMVIKTDEVLGTVEVKGWDDPELIECDIYLTLMVNDYYDSTVLVFNHGETLWRTIGRNTFSYSQVYFNESGIEELECFDGQPYRLGLAMFNNETGEYFGNVGPALADLTFTVKVEEEPEEPEEPEVRSYNSRVESVKPYSLGYGRTASPRVYKYRTVEL